MASLRTVVEAGKARANLVRLQRRAVWRHRQPFSSFIPMLSVSDSEVTLADDFDSGRGRKLIVGCNGDGSFVTAVNTSMRTVGTGSVVTLMDMVGTDRMRKSLIGADGVATLIAGVGANLGIAEGRQCCDSGSLHGFRSKK